MKLYELKFQIDDLFGQAEARTKKFIYDVNPDINAGLIDIFSISEDEHYLFMNYLQNSANEVYETIQKLSDFSLLYAQYLEEGELELPRYKFDTQDDETGQRIVQYRVMFPDNFVQTKFVNDISEALICGAIAQHFQVVGQDKPFALFSSIYNNKIADLHSIASGSNVDYRTNSTTRRRGLW